MPLDDGTELRKLLLRFYPHLLQRGWHDGYNSLSLSRAFDLEMEEVQQVLDQLATRITNVAETTREEVRKLVGQAAEEGWSAADLAQRLDDSGLFSADRAMLISRTEAASAYTRGALLAYQTSGVVDRVEWLLGPNACPECEALGGKVVGLGEEFAPGVEHPPYHPLCRCAVSPVLSED